MALRFFTLAGVIVAVLPRPSQGQTPPQLGSTRIEDDRLVEILNNATVHELNALPAPRGSGKGQLLLRLYALPRSGSCVPQSHQVCSYHYYLAVSEYDEMPRQTVYDLGEVGEIVDPRWLPDDRLGAAWLQLSVSNYPAHAFRSNPGLVRKVIALKLDVTVDTLVISRVAR